MNKFKFYLWNAYYSSLIGMAVFVLTLLGWYNSFPKLFFYLSSQHPFPMLISLLSNLLFDMAIGAIIGTISLFFVFQIFLKLTQRPLIGFVSNFLVVALLNIAGGIIQGFGDFQKFIHTVWFLALIVSEVLSLFLLSAWYKRMKFYKEKLEQKKASLHNQGAY